MLLSAADIIKPWSYCWYSFSKTGWEEDSPFNIRNSLHKILTPPYRSCKWKGFLLGLREGEVVVLGVRFAVGAGSAPCEDGGRGEEQEMLGATPASLGRCWGRVSSSSRSALSLCCHHIR